MGVDFSAYTRLRKIEAVANEDCEPLDPKTGAPLDGNVKQIYINSDFPGRASEFEHRAFYAYDEYVDGPSFSYGGYSQWRNKVAQLAGWPRSSDDPSHGYSQSAWNAEGGKLWELINFADNEGTIGTAACAKIAKEMAELQPIVDQWVEVSPWGFKERFNAMRAMFEAATDDGAVVLS